MCPICESIDGVSEQNRAGRSNKSGKRGIRSTVKRTCRPAQKSAPRRGFRGEDNLLAQWALSSTWILSFSLRRRPLQFLRARAKESAPIIGLRREFVFNQNDFSRRSILRPSRVFFSIGYKSRWHRGKTRNKYRRTRAVNIANRFVRILVKRELSLTRVFLWVFLWVFVLVHVLYKLLESSNTQN